MVIANYLDAVGSVNKWGQGSPIGATFVEATNKYGAALPSGSVVAFRFDTTTGKLEAWKDESGLNSVPRTVGVALGVRANLDGTYTETIPADEVGVFQISGYCGRVLASASTATNKNLDIARDTNKAAPATNRSVASFGFVIGTESSAGGSDVYVAAQLHGVPVITAQA